MAQMSRLRQKLGGYDLVSINNFRDISYLPENQVDKGYGTPMSYWYYFNGYKTVQKVVEGHWKFKEGKANER